MTRLMLRTTVLLTGLACAVPCQRVGYEVASIKPNTSGSQSSSTHGSKGQVIFTNQKLKRLIERAYGVKEFQVTGPGWLEDVSFDITAKYPAETQSEERSVMLRTLLEDRFRLKVHHETKELPGYALMVAKGGFLLQPVEAGGNDMSSQGGRIRKLTAKKVSMPTLADFISRDLGAMVVDDTGIGGVYDLELRWAHDDQDMSAAGADAAPSMFTALQETLGLRLQPRKVPTDIVVVDSVERVPTEN